MVFGDAWRLMGEGGALRLQRLRAIALVQAPESQGWD